MRLTEQITAIVVSVSNPSRSAAVFFRSIPEAALSGVLYREYASVNFFLFLNDTASSKRLSAQSRSRWQEVRHRNRPTESGLFSK